MARPPRRGERWRGDRVIVYGDRVSSRSVRDDIARIEAAIVGLSALPPGWRRHTSAVAALVAAGELAQGLADRSLLETGHDGPDPAADAAMAVVLALARLVWQSHVTGYRELGGAPESAGEAPAEVTADAVAATGRLARMALPSTVDVRAAEGFEHYAVYPEAYADAASALGPRFRPVVIGIRSIGTTLAAMVAAACGSRAIPLTVRPVGHPYARSLSASAHAADIVRRDPRRRFAVVDEGPGLSGSSFAAVLDVLETSGVAPKHVHVFASHTGVPPRASAATHAAFDRVSWHCRPFDAVFLGDGPCSVRGWTEDVTGPQIAPPEDVSGGRWRAGRFVSPDVWPPAQPLQERRKYLLRADRGTYVAKFAGLGRGGERRHTRAQWLAEAGFGVPVVGLCHGFLVHPWLADARPLAGSGANISRAKVVTHIARYLAFRATHTATGRSAGAQPRELLQMAIANATEALGEPGRRLECLADRIDAVKRDARPVEVDARLHVWEWLVLPDYRLLKTDAVDHCEGHDLVGCQDIAWDVAGAEVELELTAAEAETVRREVRVAGAAVAPEAVAFHRACYLAFQLGYYRMGAQAVQGFDPAEAARLEAMAARYGNLLARVCDGDLRR